MSSVQEPRVALASGLVHVLMRFLKLIDLRLCDSWDWYYANSLAHLSDSRRMPANQTDSQKQQQHEVHSDDEEDVDDDSDPGTSWFTEHNAPQKVLDFLVSPSFPLAPANTANAPSQPLILDLGTGNGNMLSLLREEGEFTGLMVGVDYSAQSVELAGRLHGNDGEEGGPNTRFEVLDILDSTVDYSALDWFPRENQGFDIVLDKGTFDAISLSEQEDEVCDASGRRQRVRIFETYPSAVKRLTRPGGFVIVTSCNWAEEELITWFTAPKQDDGTDMFTVFDRVEYPKFRFGGQEGQGVCTVCFQRTN